MNALLLALVLVQTDSAGVAVGDRVRVTAPAVRARSFVGTIVSRTPDSLTVQEKDSAARVAVAVRSIELLEVSNGRHGHALAGFGVGFLTGVTFGAVAFTSCEGFLCPEDATAAALFLGAVASVPGLLIGALVRSEDWEEMPLGR